MTYKLNPALRFIQSPIILHIDAHEKQYTDGTDLIKQEFEKNYLVTSIKAKNSSIVITLKENDQINTLNWADEEDVSFL